jgi:hypothetical protein
MATRPGAMNAIIKSFEKLIVDERDGNILNDEFLFPLALICARPKINGSRIYLAAVF